MLNVGCRLVHVVVCFALLRVGCWLFGGCGWVFAICLIFRVVCFFCCFVLFPLFVYRVLFFRLSFVVRRLPFVVRCLLCAVVVCRVRRSLFVVWCAMCDVVVC